jgi:GT2 family glycosyltransferase
MREQNEREVLTTGEPGSRRGHPRVAIIVVNWNGPNDTVACIESLHRIDYSNFEIIVVDNGSTDDSVKLLREQCPDVFLIETRENLGFAGGNNVGIREALRRDADYVLLLNNDTVADPQVLRRFVDAAALIRNDAILGAKIYYFSDPDRIWYAGAEWDVGFVRFRHIGKGCIDDGTRFNSLAETAYVCGCALFVSGRLLDMIGLLDEEFFLNFEETDLCYRARRAGYRSYIVPGAKVWHKVSTSFGGEESPLYHYFLMRNKLLWAKKHLPLMERLVIQKWALGELLRELTPLGGLSDPVRRAKLWAARDYLLGRRGDCPPAVRALGKSRAGFP